MCLGSVPLLQPSTPNRGDAGARTLHRVPCGNRPHKPGVPQSQSRLSLDQSPSPWDKLQYCSVSNSPSALGEMGSFCSPRTHFPEAGLALTSSQALPHPRRGLPQAGSVQSSHPNQGAAASHLPPPTSPQTVLDASSFHPLPSARDSSPLLLSPVPPALLGSLPLPGSPLPSSPCPAPCPMASSPPPRGLLLLLQLLARCSLVWREAINSSVSSTLIDTVWTEDGKINKGNSLRAAATFLMLKNNRFSAKVCVEYTDWHGTHTHTHRGQGSKQIIHTQCVSIFWSLSFCPVAAQRTQGAYI